MPSSLFSLSPWDIGGKYTTRVRSIFDEWFGYVTLRSTKLNNKRTGFRFGMPFLEKGFFFWVNLPLKCNA